MSEKNLRMDQTGTTRLKKLSSGGCSRAGHSTEETTNSRTNESSQANKPIRSEHVEKFLGNDVFLSHSGKQKNFVRQLYRDLTNQGVSCFFDEDPESLPVAENFPSRIFEAAKTCKVAVLLLSKDFLETKWPMLELSAFVEAQDTTRTNPNLKILPLFFLISPDFLKNITADKEKWKQLDISGEKRAEWHQALNAIRRINGLTFSEGGDEVAFRDKIVKAIWHMLPPSQRYHISAMQGEARMCQEVADFFSSVHPNEKGVRIAGLYGIAGHGKTTLGKAFCNHKLGDFEGRVCHLEFSRGDSFEKIKLALQYLTHCPQSHLQTLQDQDQAQVEFYKRVKGQRVLLVLDNITEESIYEVKDYIWANLGKDSCILLSARSVDVLVKHFKIDSKSCMHVPSLEEDDAIAILLESTSPGESTRGSEDRSLGLKCANRCSFNCDIARRGRTFHPLALKAFGGHLFSKYGSNLAKWVAEIDGLVDRSGYGLDDVFAVLDKAFDDMEPKYRTIFMLLTVYMQPNMSPHKVTQWLAINCNEEVKHIDKAVKDLKKKAFIEKFETEIRIHDLYIEFAQSKAKRMGRWLWWKGDEPSTRGLISQDNAGFELAKFEQCMHRSPSQIAPWHLQNVLVLQLVGVQNMSRLDLGRMDSLRSITLHNCKTLAALDGMEKLPYLAWLQIREINSMLKLPELSSLVALQYLEIDIAGSHAFNQLGDLTPCLFLREIIVRYPSLSDFPRINGLPYLEKVEFSVSDKVRDPLDCRGCVELQSIVLNTCCQMAASPLLTGCKKLSTIVLWECQAVTECPDIDMPSAVKTLELFISSEASSAPKSLESCYGLENLQLWNMGELKELPSFRRLSNLTVLKLGKCGIREPPDLTSCVMLEAVHFFTLQNLERFPNFSLLRKLKKLCLYNCRRVQDPPDISDCHQLQFFHLAYNDNIEGLPSMVESPQLEEIKVSWHSEEEVTYEGIDPDSCEVDGDLETCLGFFKDQIFTNLSETVFPEELKEWQWLKDKEILVKRYFRGVKLYYSLTAPYESYKGSRNWGESTAEAPLPITLSQLPINLPQLHSLTLRMKGDRVVPSFKHEMVDDTGAWTETVQNYFEWSIASATTSSETNLQIDQTEATPHSQAGHSTDETTNSRTGESSQANEPTRSERVQKFLGTDVFLSHSGKQKDFVRQLNRDLTNQGLSCFFDEDPETLPVGDESPTQIPEAAQTCKLLLVLLSKEFLETKRSMLELSTFVKARDKSRTNPNLKILPVFFMISPQALTQISAANEKWKEFEESEERWAEWHQALNAIRRNNRLKLSEGGDEVALREKIVKEIWRRLSTPSPRYRVPSMQGQVRLCQEVADLFSRVHPNQKGIRIAGLYGVAGQGKTTLGKIFCNLNLGNFYGKVCHLEFCGGNTLERQKLALHYLTHCHKSQLESLTTEDEVRKEFNKRVRGQRVLLVLDNIGTKESVDEVRDYLRAEWGKNSCILLSARSMDFRFDDFNINFKSCMSVPSLTEEEAIAILLERTTLAESTMQAEERDFALKCAKRCQFKEDSRFAPRFHPLALKFMGQNLFSKCGSNLSEWVAEIGGLDDMFAVLGKAFNEMDPKYRTIFVHLTVMLPNMPPYKVTEWLAIKCNEEIKYIEKAVEDLCKNVFIEEIEPEIRIHDFFKEFAQIKASMDDARGGVKFRDGIMRAISHLLPQAYHVPAMQGEARMCQEVANLFNTVHPNEKGIRIAGLYGMPGMGKSTLGKAFCNFNFGDFDGEVYYLEFSRGHSLDRQKFKVLTKGQRALFVLDNIETEQSIGHVRYFLQADLGKNSRILVSARSLDVLQKNFNIGCKSCMKVPGLEEDEAIAILLERTSLVQAALGAENRGFALQCANICSFKETSWDIVGEARTFHPLALKAFGQHLFSKYRFNLSNWVAELDGMFVGSRGGLNDVFTVLDKAFDEMDPKYRTIFMLLTVYMLPNMAPHKVRDWLAINCMEEMEYIEKAVEDLWQKAFIEKIEPEIRIHDLYMEFAQSKARKTGRWLWCKHDFNTSEAEAASFSDELAFANSEAELGLVLSDEARFANSEAEVELIYEGFSFLPVRGRFLFSDEAEFHLAKLKGWFWQHKARKMGRWLLCKRDLITSGAEAGFKLANLKYWHHKARKMGRWLGRRWLCKRDIVTSDAEIGYPISNDGERFALEAGETGEARFALEEGETGEARFELEGVLFSKDEAGFELAKLEYCQHQDLSQIGNKHVKNLLALQVVDERKVMSSLGFSSLKNIRSVTLHNCKHLKVLEGMENLPYLAWLQIWQLPKLKVMNLNSLTALRHLEIDTESFDLKDLGDLTGCVYLREISIRSPYLQKFPRINGLPYLEKAKFASMWMMMDSLDCKACVKLRSLVFEDLSMVFRKPLIDGCSSLSKIVLNRCHKIHSIYGSDILDLCISSVYAVVPRYSECCDGQKNLPLWNIVTSSLISMDSPNLKLFSNLTMLKLCKCYISEPPDITYCSKLEDVHFSTLEYLKSFPSFSSLRKLKRLCLYNCKRVRAPPDIGGCHELQVFHLLYNDYMRGLPKMDGCPHLQEIKLSWHSEEEIPYYSCSYEDEDLEFCPGYRKDEIFPNLNDVFVPEELKKLQWIEGKTVRIKQYCRGWNVYYSITAPFESDDGSRAWKEASIADTVEQISTDRETAISVEDEVRFKDKVMRAIHRLIPTEIMFPKSSMEDAAALIWPEKAVWSKPASPTIEGIHVVGLYEVASIDKTIVRKSLYNFTLNGFEGEVSSLEFSTGDSLERLNNALRYLTCSPGLEMTLSRSEFLDQDAFSKGPTFNIMILLIRYPMPDKFMDDNFMDIARDFHVNWGGHTRIVFRSQKYAIIEFSRQ